MTDHEGRTMMIDPKTELETPLAAKVIKEQHES